MESNLLLTVVVPVPVAMVADYFESWFPLRPPLRFEEPPPNYCYLGRCGLTDFVRFSIWWFALGWW